MGLLILAGILLAVVVAMIGCIIGDSVGPALFALGFLGVGGLMLLGGGIGLLLAFGIGFVGLGLGELVAVNEYRAAHGRPAAVWRGTATIMGVAGSIAFVALMWLLGRAIAGFYGQL